jgi:hypothetical protein
LAEFYFFLKNNVNSCQHFHGGLHLHEKPLNARVLALVLASSSSCPALPLPPKKGSSRFPPRRHFKLDPAMTPCPAVRPVKKDTRQNGRIPLVALLRPHGKPLTASSSSRLHQREDSTRAAVPQRVENIAAGKQTTLFSYACQAALS